MVEPDIVCGKGHRAAIRLPALVVEILLNSGLPLTETVLSYKCSRCPALVEVPLTSLQHAQGRTLTEPGSLS